jgi:ADP-heptose:LPS heptosyltransferase
MWPKKMMTDPKKICIYRIGNVGDIICAIPAIIAIRRAYPKAYITLLTSPGQKGMAGAKELIEGAWFIDKLWVYYSDDINTIKKMAQFIRSLRKESFDLWITLPVELWKLKTIFKNMLLARLCSKCGVGFMLSTIKIWTKEQSNIYKFDNEVVRLLNVLKFYNIPIDNKVIYQLPVTEQVKESVGKIVSNYEMSGYNLIGYVPGAKYQINQWPLDYFIEIGRYIIDKFPESKIVVLGGSDDIEKGEYIKNRVDAERVVNLAGKTSLLELAYLVKFFKLIVSNNTGPMHMAALEGIKVIGIFSSAELYGKWFPYGDNSQVLMQHISCEGCYYTCKNNKECIKTIRPDDIKRLLTQAIS